MNIFAAEHLAKELMEKWGVDNWQFVWSRGKRTHGQVVVRNGADVGHLKLSEYLVMHNDEERVRDTILHEIAHIKAGIENKHNHVWRHWCRVVGARPDRCPKSGYKQTAPPNFYLVCGICDRQIAKRYRRMRQDVLARTYCADCGRRSKGTLELVPA